MSEATQGQTLFEQYVKGEMTLQDAADALVALVRQRKAAGDETSDLRIRKPQGWSPSESEYKRAEALFDELNRRAAMG